MTKEDNKHKKIKIAFIKYAGMGTGGTERWLQNLAVKLDKNKFEVDYFYTGEEDPSRLKFMQDSNINLIKVCANGKSSAYGKWKDCDLFSKFKENDYDIVQNAIGGAKEWPFYLLKTPLVESVHLDYDVNFSLNVYHTLLLSDWNQNKWCQMGGIKSMSSVVPLGAELPSSSENLRLELNIPDDAIVSGFHQRVDDNIFSEIPIYAYKANEAENHYFVIMGGSRKYTELANKLNLKNFIQIEHSGSKERISKFLNTLDIFAHGRRDGETLGYVIIEALLHQKPCIVHKAVSNAQEQTIGPGGYFVKTKEEYSEKLRILLSDESLRKKIGYDGWKYAKEKYIDTDYIRTIENVYTDIVNNPTKSRLKAFSNNLLRNLRFLIFSVCKTDSDIFIRILGAKIKIKY